MHILFLDDQDVRHDLAEKHLYAAGHKVLHAFNVREALDIVGNFIGQIGLGMLDHDLGQFVKDSDGRRTEHHGLYFVDQLVKTVPSNKWFPRAIVHSYNQNGAKYMVDMLNKHGIHSTVDNFSGDMLKRAIAELRIQ